MRVMQKRFALAIPTLLITSLLIFQLDGPYLSPDQGRLDNPNQDEVLIPGRSSTTDYLTGPRPLGDSFIENDGQLENGDVRFYTVGIGLSIGLMPDGVIFTESVDAGQVGPDDSLFRTPDLRTCTFSLTFERCIAVEPRGEGVLGYPVNVLKGTQKDRWVRGARAYREVIYDGLFDGVDLRFYFYEGHFKYDFILDADTDPGAIELRYEGIDGLEIDQGTGDLLIGTQLGQLRDTCPVAFQEGSSAPLAIDCEFEMRGDRSWGFKVEGLRPSNGHLVIDPGMEYCTLLGGSGDEWAQTVVLDGDGDILVGGMTNSPEFPTTDGALYETIRGEYDAYIVEMDNELSTIKYATFLGGSAIENVMGIIRASDGTLVMAGQTTSYDFPVTPDAIQGTQGGGWDGYLARLSDDASDILTATYFGGSSLDGVFSICMDAEGSVYIAGTTYSDDLPTTSGAYCTSLNGTHGDYRSKDSFAVKVDGKLTSLIYSTYIGAQGRDEPCYTAIDGEGNLYMAGLTSSRDFPMVEGALNATFMGGEADGLVLMLDPDGSRILHSTFLGGIGNDTLKSISLTDDGYVLVSGPTDSPDLPCTSDAINRKPSTPFFDGFLVELDGTLTGLRYCSYIGGRWADDAHRVHYHDGRVYLLGGTTSDDIVTTNGAFDRIGMTDAVSWLAQDYVLMVFNSSDWNLTYSTYLGGSDDETSTKFTQLLVDDRGWILLASATGSYDFPTTEGAYCTTYHGRDDVFVMWFDPTPCDPPGAPRNLTAPAGDGYVDLRWQRLTPNLIYNGTRLEELRLYCSTSPDDPSPDCTVLPWYYDGFYLKDGIVNGQTYYFSLTAVNSAGEGPPARVSARPLTNPSRPEGMIGRSGNGTVVLNWTGPGDTGGELLGYRLSRSQWGAAQWTENLTSGTLRFVDDDGIRVGQTYDYVLCAYNSAGRSANVSVAVVAMGPPGLPGLITGDGQADLSWSFPERDAPNVTGFRIYWGTIPFNLRPLIDVGSEARGYHHTGLENGMRYYYRVTTLKWSLESEPTDVISGVPFGRPTVPRYLVAMADDGQVSLSWTAPVSDNGRPITGYIVHRGLSEVGLVPLQTVVGTTFTDAMVTNGITYCYSVLAVNEAGESVLSEVVSARPMGLPGPPRDLVAVPCAEGVNLSWSPPEDWGGADSLRYRVYWGLSTDSMEVLITLRDAQQYTDKGVQVRRSYFYKVSALGAVGEGPSSEIVTVTVPTVPGAVGGLNATAGDGYVELAWSPPVDDGGEPLTAFVVYRGPIEQVLDELARLEIGGPPEADYTYLDTSVENGLTYFYALTAVNSFGVGPRSAVLGVTPAAPPLPPPGRPQTLLVERSDGVVVLTWQPPAEPRRAPVTGYVLLRGTSPDSLVRMTELGPVLTYTDTTAERGRNYYYAVLAQSAAGEGERSETVGIPPAEEADRSWVGISIVGVLLILVILGMAVWMGSKSARAGEAVAVAPAGVASASGAGAAPPPSLVERPTTYIVEEIFAVYRDGRLMADCGRGECKTRDADLMSGMLIAVQGIIQDGLTRGGSLESIKYGDNVVVLVSGRYMTLAAIVYGDPGEDVREQLDSTVRRIEASFAGTIEDWSGDLTAFHGIEALVAPVLERTARLSRNDIRLAKIVSGVSLVTAIDFHQGYVRLKVVVVNGTDELVVDAAMELSYNADMLRLDRVQPPTRTRKGDRVGLGNIRPGDKVTVAFLFDPQICQSTHIDGTLLYFDQKGNYRHVDMRRRQADVVCPIFFTREHANTAMLRRLVKETLRETDMRVFRIPGRIKPPDMLRLAKQAMGMSGVQLVREYVEQEPKYYAEVWYYGETKVHSYRIVMRLGVIEEQEALEFFAASTAMEPVTGLLAEFRRELSRTLEARFPGETVLAPMEDEAVRIDIEGRELLLYKDGAG